MIRLYLKVVSGYLSQVLPLRKVLRNFKEGVNLSIKSGGQETKTINETVYIIKIGTNLATKDDNLKVYFRLTRLFKS